MAHPSNHFFSSGNARQQPKSQLVNVGGNGDCGFRSIAAALLDNCQTHPQMKSKLIDNLLTAHFQYYPEYASKLTPMHTPVQKIKQLLQSFDYNQLIETLAYTLRQLAIKKMTKEPELYQGAFTGLNEGASLTSMRQKNTWIDESAIAALAHELELPITVNVVRNDSDLPLTLSYNKAAENSLTNPSIKIQLKNAHYQPFLSAWQKPVENKPKLTLSTPKLTPVDTTEIEADILRKIQQSNAVLINRFNDASQQLTKWVANGRLNKESLLTIYSNGMKQSDYLQGRVKYIGIEHGHQDFFEQALSRHAPQGASLHTNSIHDTIIVDELIKAIARSISIGHLSLENDVSAVMEAKGSLQHHRRLG